MKEKYRFALSFSAGKDSFLAMKKMIEDGHVPACLITSVLPIGRSHMHGLRISLLEQYSESLGIPILFDTTREKFDRSMALETARKAKTLYRADASCTGDISLSEPRDFNSSIARELGMAGFYPLFGMDEETYTRELIDSGFTVMIKSLSTALELDELVGTELDEKAIRLLAQKGVRLTDDTTDIHTVVVDGPFFIHPISYRFSDSFHKGKFTMTDMLPVS
ncbi:MAG: hypothetical protein IKE43_02225 [Coriobacteriales bacterium]|nr:hypothetical protein [Coriobacteriales bacterium]